MAFLIWIRRTSPTPFSWTRAATVVKANSGSPWSRCPRTAAAGSAARGRTAKIDARCTAPGAWALAALPGLGSRCRRRRCPARVSGRPEWHAEEAVPPAPPATVESSKGDGEPASEPRSTEKEKPHLNPQLFSSIFAFHFLNTQ